MQGHLLALHVTLADVQDRERVAALAEAVQEATGNRSSWLGGSTKATQVPMRRVKLAGAKRGFVLLPSHWVVGRSFGLATRFRRLAKDYERLTETLEGMHYVAFSILLHKAAPHFCWSS
jgi:transposase